MNESDVQTLLSKVEDPDLGDDIVSLGLVNDIEIRDEVAHISLALGAPYSPNETAIAARVREVLGEEELSRSTSPRASSGATRSSPA